MSDYSNDPFEMPDWVNGYIRRLFSQRGYNATEDSILNLIEGQWPSWKRLLIESGLCHDRQLAEDVAYKFSLHKVIGNAGKIFENFAEFVNCKPKEIREFEESRYNDQAPEDCDLCDGLGIIMAEVVNREGRVKNAAFGCRCQKGRVVYGGVMPATEEIIECARLQRRQKATREIEYLRSLDIDPHKPFRFRDLFRSITKKPVKPAHVAVAEFRQHRSGNLSVKTHGSNAGNARAVSGDSDIWAESDDGTALLVYQNGDERGWE